MNKFVKQSIVLIACALTVSVVGTVVASRLARAETTACLSVKFVMTDLNKKFPKLAIVPLDGESSDDFMAAYNAEPPATNIVSTQQVILFHPAASRATIFFFKNGCYAGRDTMNAAKVRGFMKAKKLKGTSA